MCSLILAVEVPDVESVAGDYRADVLDGSVWSAWVGHRVARAEAEDFHLHQRHVVLILFMDTDVETLVFRPHGMIGEPDIFLDDMGDVRGDELVLLASGGE